MKNTITANIIKTLINNNGNIKSTVKSLALDILKIAIDTDNTEKKFVAIKFNRNMNNDIYNATFK